MDYKKPKILIPNKKTNAEFTIKQLKIQLNVSQNKYLQLKIYKSQCNFQLRTKKENQNVVPFLIIQLNYMQRNIHRGRKKKVTRTYKDQEQLASDKLFEISHYCEEKFEDESKMLVLDTNREKDSNTQPAIDKKIERNNLHPRQKLKIRQRQCSLRQYRTIQMTQITEKMDNKQPKISNTVQNIFNTLESKHVFVGLKKQINQPRHSNPQSDHFLEFKPRKRMETMPISEKNVHLAVIKLTMRQPRSQTIGGRLPHKNKPFNVQKYINGMARGQKKLLCEFNQVFRQKLRNSIFGFSERKLGLNFF